MLDLRMTNRHIDSSNGRHLDSRSDASKHSDSAYSSPAKRWRGGGSNSVNGIEAMGSSFDAGSSSKASDLGAGTVNEMDRSYSTATSPSLDDQAENLSMSAANSEDGSASMTTTPDKGQYLGMRHLL